jgi:Carboxypeptidase regulatory-like domain
MGGEPRAGTGLYLLLRGVGIRRSVAVLVLAAVVGAGAAPAARAQAIRSTLRAAGTHRPVVGAFVIVADSAGREVSRTLTDQTGRVRLDVPPGRYRFIVLRIGMARWASPPFSLASTDTITAPLDAPETPVSLSAIVVHAERRCRTRPDEGTAAATLWEEASKALEATQWTIAHPVYRFRSRRYVRTFGPTGDGPLTDERRVVSEFASWPFVSLAPESLAARGYAQPDSQHIMTYYGLDLPVLLSTTFLERHCFRVERGRGHAADSLVGLAFEPTGRRDQVDVAGVLWLDRGSAALEEVEFHYTHLGPWAGHGAVGRVVFQRLPNGAWVIRRWSIRMPLPRIGRRSVFIDGRLTTGPLDTLGLAGYREEGGWVAAVLSATGDAVVRYPDEP